MTYKLRGAPVEDKKRATDRLADDPILQVKGDYFRGAHTRQRNHVTPLLRTSIAAAWQWHHEQGIGRGAI